jgi:hypothetical protein
MRRPPAAGPEFRAGRTRRWPRPRRSLGQRAAAITASTVVLAAQVDVGAPPGSARSHASASSNASPPRCPAIRMQRPASIHVTQPRIHGWPANDPYRSHTGPLSPRASSSRLLHCSTATSSWPSRRLTVMAPVVPPRPARPENGTTALVAPRRASSSHTAWRAASSRRPGRSRAVCGWEASRPKGVWHGSPGSALHVGHARSRQPRAMCSGCVGLGHFRESCQPSRQRPSGAAQQCGHH